MTTVEEPPLASAPEIGADLGGRYRLRDSVQRCGRAVLWNGWDATLQRGVSIKVGDATAGAQLAREAQALAVLRHDVLPELFDASPADAAPAYLVVERLRGLTLHRWLESAGRLDHALVLLVGRRLVELLCHLHTRGWALGGFDTRDVVLLADDDQHLVKVVDMSRIGRNDGMSFPADIASVGALLASLLTGSRAEPCASEWRELVRVTTAADPRDRPDALAVLRTLAGFRDVALETA